MMYLVTGSDKEKTLEQVGEQNIQSKRVYNCPGNDAYEGETNVYRSDWTIPKEAEGWLREELAISKPLRTGKHLEDRHGMCNFSVVGRNATLGERKLYVEHDTKWRNVKLLQNYLGKSFPILKQW